MSQFRRLLGLAMCALVGQSKRLTMQARPSPTWVLFWRAIHDAAFDQAHQEIGVDGGVCQSLEVVPTIERYHWAGCVCGSSLAHPGDLLEGDRRRRLRRRSTTVHIQRQHPAASRLRHRHQPLIRPGRHNAVLRPTWQRPILPRPIGARACRWPRPVGAVDHPHRSAVDHRRIRQRSGKQAAQLADVDRAIRQCVARARPSPTKCGRQAESDKRAALGCRQRGIHQLEQAILT
jgi:hypothetical protein